MKQSKVVFDKALLSQVIYNNVAQEQTNLLIDYAKKKIIEIGDKIQQWGGRNHMYRTGNLLNSLCWGVSFDNKLVDSGFYREETIHSSKGVDKDGRAYLHEFSPYRYAFPVEGRRLAQEYIKRYGNVGGKGWWRVFWAILAPYWGFWERGFTQTHGLSHNPRYGHNAKGIIRGATFQQFAVMSQTYDVISKDLTPAKTTIKVGVPTYTPSFDIQGRNGGKQHIMGTMERAYANRVDKAQYGRRKKYK